MANLRLIKSNITREERLQNRIDSFCSEILMGEGQMDHLNAILLAIHDYMIQYDDPNVIMASIKIKEAGFYIDEFLLPW